MGEIDDVETQLRQEFGHLAGTITVPAAPGVAGVSVRPHRRWVLPATVAAAVLLLLVGVTVAIGHRHGPTQPTDGVPKSIPTVPFVLRQILYVDGSPMPGRWYEVVSAGDSWVAGKRGSGWWWSAATACPATPRRPCRRSPASWG